MKAAQLPPPMSGHQQPLDVTYRVFGVRYDKSRVMLGDRMKLQHAQRLRELLAAGNVFASIEIEPDGHSAPGLDLQV